MHNLIAKRDYRLLWTIANFDDLLNLEVSLDNINLYGPNLTLDLQISDRIILDERLRGKRHVRPRCAVAT